MTVFAIDDNTKSENATLLHIHNRKNKVNTREN